MGMVRDDDDDVVFFMVGDDGYDHNNGSKDDIGDSDDDGDDTTIAIAIMMMMTMADFSVRREIRFHLNDSSKCQRRAALQELCRCHLCGKICRANLEKSKRICTMGWARRNHLIRLGGRNPL